MAYQSAWPCRSFLTMDMCWPRTNGCSPVARSSPFSILNPSASTSFSKEGVVMVSAHSPMSSAAVSKALCNTKSCWCFVARARASQPGGDILSLSPGPGLAGARGLRQSTLPRPYSTSCPGSA